MCHIPGMCPFHTPASPSHMTRQHYSKARCSFLVMLEHKHSEAEIWINFTFDLVFFTFYYCSGPGQETCFGFIRPDMDMCSCPRQHNCFQFTNVSWRINILESPHRRSETMNAMSMQCHASSIAHSRTRLWLRCIDRGHEINDN